MKRLLRFVFAAALLAGCSSSGSSSSGLRSDGKSESGTTTASETGASASVASNADVDPCSLVTKEEVAAVVGFPVNDGKSSDDPTGKTCSFFGDGTNIAKGAVIQAQSQMVFSQIYDHIDDGLLGKQFKLTKVDGLGDKAFTQITNGMSGTTAGIETAFSEKGAYIFVGLLIDDPSPDHVLQLEKGLAEKAAARL